jgi:hypothetical protein
MGRLNAEPGAAANRRGMAPFQSIAALPPRRWLSGVVRPLLKARHGVSWHLFRR